MSDLFGLRNVSFSYGKRPVLHDLSLSFEEGRVTALLGPNGSGKTTLLKVLLGLLTPTAGTITFCGRDLRMIPRRTLAGVLAYVPQAHREAFSYSVREVVLMGRIAERPVFGGYGEPDLRMVTETLDALAIRHLADRPYTEISGGERQLTLIARALAQGARTLVMDEPASALDYGNQLRLLERIRCLARSGLGFICSSHNPNHALTIADRVIFLREGRVIADGTPKEVVTRERLSMLYGIDMDLISSGSFIKERDNREPASPKEVHACES